MPELPEVETIKNGLAPYVQNLKIFAVITRCNKLRWPIPDNLQQVMTNQKIHLISRRGKYLVFHLDDGILLIHLGMSGRLCLIDKDVPVQKHDHMDIILENQQILRYTDPRRFGAILYSTESPENHPLLKNLGVEPLTDALTVDYLTNLAAKRKTAVKAFIMDGKIVVGVGNIYATEALFLSGINPLKPANTLTREQWQTLIEIIQQVLKQAIAAGGTTLKDFVNGFGSPGYFVQKLSAYGRAGLACFKCDNILQSCVIGQRSTVFCSNCQV